MSGEWFDIAFDDLYADLYAHRDREEAERAVGWVERALGARGLPALAGSRCVDLACGAGRHLLALAGRGARAVGVDRSRALLSRAHAAREGEGSGTQYELVAGDLRRLPLASRSFAVALSMFTSIGYFARDEEHRAALVEVARILYPGGAFVVDYMNAEAVARTLVPRSEREVGEYLVTEERRIDTTQHRIAKQVRVSRRATGELVKLYAESVAMWSRAELEARIRASGFAVRLAAGDYDGGPFTTHSPRLILIAELVTAAA